MLTTMFGKPEKNVHAQQRIESAIASFMASHKLRIENKDFDREFQLIQDWQARRLLVQYDHLFADQQTAAAAKFMLQEVYSGHQLAVISDEVIKTARKAWRLVPGDMVEAAANAIEANVLTVQIDENIARQTIQLGGLDPLSASECYSMALRRSDILSQRRQQLEKFQSLASSIEVYLRKNSVHFGLKMTSGLANRAGVYNLHQFLSRACRLLRDTKDLTRIVNEITRTELLLLDQVEQGMNPFAFMDLPKAAMGAKRLNDLTPTGSPL